MKPFNLQEALAGKPVVTRDRRKVARVIHIPEASAISWRAIAVIKDGPVLPVDEQGRYFSDREGSNDLFMASEKKEGWIAIYSPSPNYVEYFPLASTHVYPTEQAARTAGESKNLLAVVKVSWEE